MDEKPDQFVLLERAEFIFRHPWIILSSFLIVFNIFHAYALSLPSQYNTGSTIFFETTGAVLSEAMNAKKDAAEKILSGPNIDTILSQVFKDSGEKPGSRSYDALAARLRDSNNGIKFNWGKQGSSYILSINFSYPDPQLSYRSAVATTDMVIKESTQKVAREMEANMAFYTSQRQLYEEKIDAIDRETEDIRAELIRRFPELSEEERDLVTKSAGSSDLSKETSVKKYEMFDEALEKLRLELSDMQRKREDLRKALESGGSLLRFSDQGSFKEDIFLGEYSKAIATKELEVATLLARGFKSEHPHIDQLRQEIEQLREMRKKRIGQLRSGNVGSQEYEYAKEEVKVEIDDLDMRIRFTKDKIRQINESRQETADQFRARPIEGDIKQKVARLMSLSSEKNLNKGYYDDMTRRLAWTELKYRSEKEEAGFKIGVVQEPSVPTVPDASQTNKIILNGLMVSLLLSGGIAYLLDAMKVPIRSGKALTEALQVPVLATIDRIATPRQIAAEHKRLARLAIGTVAVMVISRVVIAVLFSAKG